MQIACKIEHANDDYKLPEHVHPVSCRQASQSASPVCAHNRPPLDLCRLSNNGPAGAQDRVGSFDGTTCKLDFHLTTERWPPNASGSPCLVELNRKQSSSLGLLAAVPRYFGYGVGSLSLRAGLRRPAVDLTLRVGPGGKVGSQGFLDPPTSFFLSCGVTLLCSWEQATVEQRCRSSAYS